MKPFRQTVCAFALAALGAAGCGHEERAAAGTMPAPAPPAADVVARRAHQMAQGAFWNQSRTVTELGIDRGQRQRMDAILAEFLEPLRERNRTHREAVEAWIAALASGDTAAASVQLARAVELDATSAREDLLVKGRLLAELTPAARARLAATYPRFLAAGWVRANRIIDTSDLGKWTEPLPPGRRPRS